MGRENREVLNHRILFMGQMWPQDGTLQGVGRQSHAEGRLHGPCLHHPHLRPTPAAPHSTWHFLGGGRQCCLPDQGCVDVVPSPAAVS